MENGPALFCDQPPVHSVLWGYHPEAGKTILWMDRTVGPPALGATASLCH